MAELGLVDYFVMGEAIGIVATLLVSFYYSRKQMQKLSTDIETKVLSDLDDKSNELTRLAIEKPQLMKIFSNVESELTEELFDFTSNGNSCHCHNVNDVKCSTRRTFRWNK